MPAHRAELVETPQHPGVKQGCAVAPTREAEGQALTAGLRLGEVALRSDRVAYSSSTDQSKYRSANTDLSVNFFHSPAETPSGFTGVFSSV